ncbi:MAG: 50S ribosomal protein L17 [Bacteroidia bacterium]|nr:50S ribosomal protein L17 [Bacteroidia bacterium]
MRHGKKFNHLGRNTGHRKALLSNMAASLILHKRINTTLAKAKALKVYVEPLITKSKTDSTHSRRQVFSYLQNKDAVVQLFRDVATKVASRPGGYTRIIKTGNRLGDNAEMCLIELVDYNEIYNGGKAEKAAAKPTRRSRAKKAAPVAEGETAVSDEAKPKAKKATPKKKKAEGDDKAE